MKISDMSKKYNISSDTLRYYDRIGLMSHAERSRTGRREYGQSDCAELECILNLKTLDMSLKDIKEYLSLRKQGVVTTRQRFALLLRHRTKLSTRAEALRKNIEQLDNMLGEFDSRDRKVTAAAAG